MIELEHLKDAELFKLEGSESGLQPEGGEQWVLAFPRGKFFIQHLEKSLVFDDLFFNRVIENFNDASLTKPFIDKNHELKESFGDIKDFEIIEEGLNIKVKLNESGVTELKNRNYRYHSPTFGNLTDTTGKKRQDVLVSISLTNIPALMGNLPQLQDQLSLENTHEQVYTLHQIKEDDRMIKLTQMLNLMDEASPEAIMEAVIVIKDSLTEALSVIESITAEKEVAEGDKEAAEEKVEEMEKELSGIKLKADEEEKELFFKDALESGKVTTPDVTKLSAMWGKDKEWVKDFVGGKEAKEVDAQVSLSAPNAQMIKLEDENDAFIMKDKGMDPSNPEDVKKYIDIQTKF